MMTFMALFYLKLSRNSGGVRYNIVWNMKNNYTSFFSIVIPVLNEEKYLPKLLKDLSVQTLKDFEVIVVDGNSEDKTVAKALAFQKKLNLQIISAKKRSVSFQRNIGGDASHASWILFMDADNRLPKFFLEGLKYQITKHPTVEVFTTWLKVDGSSKMNKLIQNSINLDIEISNIIGNQKSMGAMMGIKNSIFAKHCFDESQHFMEDSLLVKELCDNGYKFKIFHDPTFTYSLRRIKKEGNLKMLRTMIQYQFHYLLGGDFSKPFSAKQYPMLGGSYYEIEKGKDKHWYSSVQHFIRTASHKQLEQARKILHALKEADFA